MVDLAFSNLALFKIANAEALDKKIKKIHWKTKKICHLHCFFICVLTIFYEFCRN